MNKNVAAAEGESDSLNKSIWWMLSCILGLINGGFYGK